MQKQTEFYRQFVILALFVIVSLLLTVLVYSWQPALF